MSEMLANAIRELSLLLRIGLTISSTDEHYDDRSGIIYLSFLDVDWVLCGGERFLGCAYWQDTPQRIEIATHGVTDDVLLGVIQHELLHVLALMGHAESGIMSHAEEGEVQSTLSDMDRAQVWLFSNPLFTGGVPLSAVEQVARFGEWDKQPPTDSECYTDVRDEGRSLYVKCTPV